MKKIKFRIWDKYNKRWLFPKNDKDQINIILNSDGTVNPFGISPECVIFQRFTGLRDKNKKPIYEGDILKTYTDENPDEVIFEYGYFCLKNTGDFLFELNEKSKILGNIFENPKLLRQ